MKRQKNWIRKIIIIAGWLLVWQAVSLLVGNRILLVGPVETLGALVQKLPEAAFWKSCMGSVLRIAAGFFLGVLLGVVLALLSYRFALAEEILAPVMALLKAVPVASFVVIFLIWFRSGLLATTISLCITLPNMYVNTLEGMKHTDKKLLEMAQVFELSEKDCFFYIYRPAWKPFWESAVGVSAGMSWKSGVAAEVIGLPAFAIGEQLYMSKIYLDTAGVLAWTVVVILLSAGFEHLVKWLGQKFFAWEPACRGIAFKEAYDVDLKLDRVSKSYGSGKVLEEVSAVYCHGQQYLFQTPSGSGKTTLFRLIAGLEKTDAGEITRSGQRIGYLFQEDRLCEAYSAVKNVELITGNEKKAREALLALLEEDALDKPCRELSGGMKRRVALVRAIMAGADILLLDEPFNGLDEENRERVAEYIKDNEKNSIVLMATHVK